MGCLKSNPLLVIFVVWGGVVAWHPFFLGFYSDDWPLLIPKMGNKLFIDSLSATIPDFPRILLQLGFDPTILANRPGHAFLLFILRGLLPDSVFFWQSVSTLLSAATACSMYFLTIELLLQYGYKKAESGFAAMLAVVIYLIGPWFFVASAWPTLVPGAISQILAIVGLTTLIRNKANHPLYAGLLMLMGLLIGETFVFLFVSVVIFLYGTNRWTIRECMRFSSIAVVATLILILTKLSLNYLWSTPKIRLVTDFMPFFIENLRSYPRAIRHALRPISFNWFMLIVIAMVFFSFVVDNNYRRIIASVGALCMGLILNALLYAVGGYGISGIGIMSRTLMAQHICFSLFIAVMIVPVVAKPKQLLEKPFNRLACMFKNLSFYGLWGAYAGLVLIFIIGTVAVSTKWIKVWHTEVSLLKQFPVANIMEDLAHRSPKEKMTVVVQIDADKQGAIFGAYYEVTYALAWMYPELMPYIENSQVEFLLGREDEWSSFWDGRQVTQKWCHNNITVYVTPNVREVIYIRLKEDGSFIYDQYTPNFTIGCHV